jgi:hypothetical protein
MVTFKEFCGAFLPDIAARDFGDPGSLPELEVDVLSPGAKELQTSGAIAVLRAPSLLHRFHRLLRECERLIKEQDKVRRTSRSASQLITKLRNARKTLKTLQKSVLRTDGQLEKLMGWKFRDHLYAACKQLELAADLVEELEKTQASTIHPADRRAHDKREPKSKYQTSAWKQLIKPYDYDLESLKKKAPQQWLVEALNSALAARFRGDLELSDLTRYRIITALCQAGGLDPIQALTIKEYFMDKAKNSAARKMTTP